MEIFEVFGNWGENFINSAITLRTLPSFKNHATKPKQILHYINFPINYFKCKRQYRRHKSTKRGLFNYRWLTASTIKITETTNNLNSNLFEMFWCKKCINFAFFDCAPDVPGWLSRLVNPIIVDDQLWISDNLLLV